ncbi:SCO-spondin-like [Trichoplusia ni]|uniref:SCO-spondin-like n=1 Tax=Trichoplusia ni TaxID=7111 RepID=A0A7E5VMV2_TRINI|nr:SCO-spondin-like [Trichoplusia ni]
MLKLFIVLISCCTVMCAKIFHFNLHKEERFDGMNCKSDEVAKRIYPCPGERNCNDRYNPRLCLASIQRSYPACVCKDGLLRAEDGSCYTNEQCDKWKCPGDHEHYECASECDNVCATLDRQNKTNCPIRKYDNFDICSPRCYCDDGYARDDKGNCIPIEDCDKLRTP